MTESPELGALRRTTVFLKAIVDQLDIVPETTVITVRIVDGAELAKLNLGEVLREADAAIAFADPPQPSERRLS